MTARPKHRHPQVENSIMRRAANRGSADRIFCGVARILAGALLLAAVPALSAEPEVEPETQACAQDDVASFAIRACTALITSAKFSTKDLGRIYTWRGKAWLTEDDPEAAAADYTRALEIDPLNVTALRDRALAYTMLGEHAKAVEDWSRLITDQPANDQYYRSRGSGRLAAGQHDEALADFDKSIELSPSAVDAYIGRASVFDALKQRGLAEKEFKKAIAISPQYLPLFWARAEMSERWGEQHLAIKDYTMVLKINGVYASARKALVRLGIQTPP